jgi:hypothetical protein
VGQQQSGNSRVVEIFRLNKTSCVVGEANNSCYVKSVEYIVNREVVVMKVVFSELSYGTTLSEEVGNGFICVSA